MFDPNRLTDLIEDLQDAENALRKELEGYSKKAEELESQYAYVEQELDKDPDNEELNTKFDNLDDLRGECDSSIFELSLLADGLSAMSSTLDNFAVDNLSANLKTLRKMFS